MKVSELRIGNYVECEGMSPLFRVDAIEWNNHQGYVLRMFPFPGRTDSLYLSLDERAPVYAKPVPLTDELLLKCGFDYDTFLSEDEFHYKIDSFYLDSQFRPVLDDEIPCQYLHQLQNLCFTLTGEELEVKS